MFYVAYLFSGVDSYTRYMESWKAGCILCYALLYGCGVSPAAHVSLVGGGLVGL